MNGVIDLAAFAKLFERQIQRHPDDCGGCGPQYLQNRLAPPTTSLVGKISAALQYTLCLLGFMRPTPACRLLNWRIR
jgi:hypothetical protein